MIQEDVAAESQSAEEQLPVPDIASNALDPTFNASDPASDAPDPESTVPGPATDARDLSGQPPDMMEAQPSSEKSPIEIDSEQVPTDS